MPDLPDFVMTTRPLTGKAKERVDKLERTVRAALEPLRIETYRTDNDGIILLRFRVKVKIKELEQYVQHQWAMSYGEAFRSADQDDFWTFQLEYVLSRIPGDIAVLIVKEQAKP